MMGKSIIILTTGQPSTNPRMVKEYQALKEEGYSVKVYYSFWQSWALEGDKKLFSTKEIPEVDFELVGGDPKKRKVLYFFSRLIHKLFLFIYNRTGRFRDEASSRAAPFLINKAIRNKADLYIAHNPGAWPGAIKAAKKYQAKATIDLEDFHRGDFKQWEAVQRKLVTSLENEYIPQCNFLTAASPLIGKAYKNLYNEKEIVIVNNVFSKKYLQELRIDNNDVLKLFWFSQTIGQFRGIETVVKAIKLLPDNFNVELYLMGNLSSGFDLQLKSLSPKSNVYFLPPTPPDEIFNISSKFDVGLSIEIPYCDNKNFCLANKAFTYMLAGNCIIFSNTEAHLQFIEKFPDVGFVYQSENEIALASLIKDLYINRDKVINARRVALHLASEELNWEMESKKLKTLISSHLSK